MIKNYVKNDKETMQLIIVLKLRDSEDHKYALNNWETLKRILFCHILIKFSVYFTRLIKNSKQTI